VQDPLHEDSAADRPMIAQERTSSLHQCSGRAAAADRRREIDASGNRVRIPILKHREISDWYRTPSAEFGGLTPRQYLADKPAEVHERIGIKAMIIFKVLKP
jgi:hypothetical protein